MISVKLQGGLGNNMFQYSLGRILAEKKKYNLIVDNIQKLQNIFVNATCLYDYNSIKENVLELGKNTEKRQWHSFNYEEALNHNGQIFIDGFFQKYEYYINNIVNIKNWFYYNSDDYLKPNETDLVIHYRLSDYITTNWYLLPDVFLRIIEKNNIKYKNCYIITEDPNHKYINELKNKIKNSIVLNQTEMQDFIFLKYSKQMIISHSSFSWWASFLGEQEKIYVPYCNDKRHLWKYLPDNDDADLIYSSNKFIKEKIEN